ncbi:SigB/SigF/SigG family RNA polymerase sigma factor [Nocardioides koreensis]|uniref:SigB/SigF/SigG family RNA polymerase sigma factor n=1 Tax=Nocardioides koreensis TaxID=433651 RepID=A0ABN2Z720_9ACTN
MTDVTSPKAPLSLAPQPSSPAGNARTRRRAETCRLLEEAARSGSTAERSALLDRVIELNLAVAREVAQRYRRRGIPDEDLVQVANLALVKAAQGFDPGLGADFLSYAVPTIRGEIRRYFRDYGWTVRPPRSIQEAQTKIAAARSELYHELGRSPRPSDIAAHTGLEVEVVQEALAADGCFAPASLDASTDGLDPAERLGEEDAGFVGAEARATLSGVLDDLTPRERRMLELRFFGDCTQAEIGAEIGVTQMQVSRLLNRLLARLRERLEDEHGAA